MWILTQDKTTLNNVAKCCGISVRRKQIVVEYGETDGYFVIGEYECPKEAKRVYSQITEWIGAGYAGAVFVMPPSGGLC